MQDTLMDHERRIATMGGALLEMRETLRSIDSRLTNFMAVTIILWATTIITVIGTAVGFFLGTR